MYNNNKPSLHKSWYVSPREQKLFQLISAELWAPPPPPPPPHLSYINGNAKMRGLCVTWISTTYEMCNTFSWRYIALYWFCSGREETARVTLNILKSIHPCFLLSFLLSLLLLTFFYFPFFGLILLPPFCSNWILGRSMDFIRKTPRRALRVHTQGKRNDRL